MSFIPLIAETAGAVGSFVAEETGSGLLGTIASSELAKQAGNAIESASKSFVDNIFGTGTFDNLENSINQFYSTGKNLATDISNIQSQVERGTFGTEEIEKLRADKEAFNKTAVVKGLSQFSKDLSHLVSIGNYNALDGTSEAITNNNSVIANVLNTLARVNPFYSYLASKFTDKLSDFVVPNNENYLKVASIYTGEGLYSQKMKVEQINLSYQFSLIDEIGNPVIWNYPEYNNYVVIPPIFGTWTGLNSPNNSVCLTGSVDGVEVESFLDKIAFIHDVGYHDLGTFNEFSDYRLISNAKFGKDNGLFIFPNELATANVAIAYFSTLGVLMRKMFGSSDSIPIGDEVAQVEEPLIKEVLLETTGTVIENVQDIKNDTVEAIRSIPTRYGSDTVGSANFELRNLINNLEIEIN